ncbi:G8 domain-containing protein [Alienimonas sp. DA493]|uniref:G8 domain-containing protein n=1 Tax=Alienimonas sp. DA493 TaxID=3373605 RepID=UPI003754F53C
MKLPLFLACVACVPCLGDGVAVAAEAPPAAAAEAPLVRSRQSGPWSAVETWDAGRVPQTGDRVVVRAGHHVAYDVDSREVIRLVQVAGTLEFARDRDTRLEAGLISVIPSESPTEEGFDCHLSPDAPGHAHGGAHGGAHDGAPDGRPALLIGEPGAPVPAEFSATIRLHHVQGTDPQSCPALINCGGRLELHGAPMPRTWVKLQRTAEVGTTRVALAEPTPGWEVGDQVIVTSTERQRDRRGPSGGFFDNAQTEPRRIVRLGSKDFTGGYPLELDKPLLFEHYADGDFRAEVANLSRNVVVESADPDGVRGHTMIHADSAGSIGYAEFRHLGKRDVLGRYSLHFHLCGTGMRGSSVIGASIWDSHNRFLTIHGTDGLVVRDCVGYKSVGHGFFLEDGTETNNVLDRNLAVTVGPGKPLPEQVIPFDPNRGAGFWFANCQNVFTRNVAAECAEYGYRFDCKRTDDFDPVLPIRSFNGTVEARDTRTMPFVRFEGNEAHTMKFFCMNLRGVTRPERGLDIYNQNVTLAREAAEAVPTPGYPFWIRDFRCWEANWALHLGAPGVFVDGLNVFRSDVAIWRSVMDRSGFRRMTTREMRVNDIHNPLSVGLPDETEEESAARRSFRGVSSFTDDLPPTTLVTRAVREGTVVRVEGSVADASDVKQVLVNGRPARSTRDHFAEWEVALEAPAGEPLEVVAVAEDVNGLVEPTPHRLTVPTGPTPRPMHSASVD